MEIEINKAYEMDCVEFLRKLPDESVDLVVTDPPYGIDIASNGKVGGDNLGKAKDYGICEWDKSIPSKECFDEMKRVSKHQIIFGGNYMTEHLKPSSCWIVWDKDNTGNFADCELAWASFPKAVRKFKFRWNGMLQERMNFKEKRFHPTQKPVALGRWILDNFATKGDLIFDPFAGSGSFLLASKQKGFDFVGCEINKDYVAVCKNRLAQQSVADFTSATPTLAKPKEFNMGLKVPTSSPPKPTSSELL
jgi:site-specific DNA-methyltransferase (adenine-specific)